MGPSFNVVTTSFRTRSLEDFLKAFSKGEKVHYVIVPSMSFDKKLLDGIEGIEHYELRSFWEILRVKRKNTFVTFISSEPVSLDIWNHFIEVFNLSEEEVSRIFFIKCPRVNNELSLSKNLLMNKRCIEQIKKSFKSENVLLEAFVSTEGEQNLASALGIPTWYGHPQMNYFHTKSGNRFLVGSEVLMPKGIADLYSKESVLKALIQIKNQDPECSAFMVKLNFGVSGQGNMKVIINENNWNDLGESKKRLIAERSFLNGDLFNNSMSVASFEERIVEEGAVVEQFVRGELVDSPSAQVMVTPDGVELISTHRQILDSFGQKFIGGEYPCDQSYVEKISEMALLIGKKLKKFKVYGVSSVDFLLSRINGKVECFVIELNIRKGGTTHPFMLSNFAIDLEGKFKKGLLLSKNNTHYVYRSNDNFYPCKITAPKVSDLMIKSKKASILFNKKVKKGVIFHLLNAYTDFGKVGYTVLAPTKSEVLDYEKTLNQVLRPNH